MKVIDLATETPSLGEVLNWAATENVVMKSISGREFVVAELDDLDEEIALIRGNQELMDLLDHRSQDKTRIPFDQVRTELGLD